MISRTTEKFRKRFALLPAQIRRQTKDAYAQFKLNPFYPSLRFKRIHSTKPIFSARINLNYRVVGIMQENTIIWFWVGSHTEYDKLIQKL